MITEENRSGNTIPAGQAGLRFVHGYGFRFSIIPDVTNGIKRTSAIALQDAVAGQKFDVFIADERETTKFS